jgi:hypothetical protein
MMMKKRTTRKLSSSSSSSLVVVIFGVFLFLSSSLYTPVAVAEKDPTTTTSTSSQLRSNSKCIDRGYDPNVVRCDYCRFALKDALGENDNQNQFVSAWSVAKRTTRMKTTMRLMVSNSIARR